MDTWKLTIGCLKGCASFIPLSVKKLSELG